MGAERRGRVICGRWSMVNRTEVVWEELAVTTPESSGKPFDISKRDVWEAYKKVKGNQGAPGVDKQTLEAFEADLAGNLYKVWNRMSSGSYFPPAVLAVEIPKPHGGGTRVLGVPTEGAYCRFVQ